jgi:three-Cys-motif partner protein
VPQIPQEIRRWTALKLEHLDAYLQAYVQATKSWGERYYIDGFAGCGDCVLVENQMPAQGSPWRALEAVPPFSAYYFIEKNGAAADHLRQRINQAGASNAHVLTGDCNKVIPAQVLPELSKRAPSFAFLDPYGLQLNWDTVVQLAEHRSESRYKMELLVLYPYDMAINRSLSWQRAYPALDRFYGDGKIWRTQLEASDSKQETAEQRRDRFLRLYKERLRVLGYTFVDSYGPLYDRHRPKYHVIFAGDNAVGAKIMQQVWSRLRAIPGELGYQPVRRPKS